MDDTYGYTVEIITGDVIRDITKDDPANHEEPDQQTMTEQETQRIAVNVADMQEYNALRQLEAETERLMIRYRHQEAKRLYHEAKRLAEKAEGGRKWWKETAAIDAAYLFGVACGGTFAWLFLRFFV